MTQGPDDARKAYRRDLPDWIRQMMPGPQCDTVEGASGQFGYDRSNPIPGDGYACCRRLRCPNGHPYFFHRLGSLGEGPDMHIVDCVELVCFGRESHIKLYVDMYHEGTSRLAPHGLSLGEADGKGSPRGRFLDFPECFERGSG